MSDDPLQASKLCPLREHEARICFTDKAVITDGTPGQMFSL